MAERIITYPLHVNAMQYRYICHEVQRTRQVYLYFRNMILKNYEKVKQHQCKQLLTKDEIAIQLHTYLQKYAPMITWLEEQSMVKDLWQFRLAYTTAEKTPSTYYRCENITNTLYWRHLNLRALIYDVAYWQLEPILFHWEIIGSCLWYHKGRVFLKLHFQTLL